MAETRPGSGTVGPVRWGGSRPAGRRRGAHGGAANPTRGGLAAALLVGGPAAARHSPLPELPRSPPRVRPDARLGGRAAPTAVADRHRRGADRSSDHAPPSGRRVPSVVRRHAGRAAAGRSGRTGRSRTNSTPGPGRASSSAAATCSPAALDTRLERDRRRPDRCSSTRPATRRGTSTSGWGTPTPAARDRVINVFSPRETIADPDDPNFGQLAGPDEIHPFRVRSLHRTTFNYARRPGLVAERAGLPGGRAGLEQPGRGRRRRPVGHRPRRSDPGRRTGQLPPPAAASRTASSSGRTGTGSGRWARGSCSAGCGASGATTG